MNWLKTAQLTKWKRSIQFRRKQQNNSIVDCKIVQTNVEIVWIQKQAKFRFLDKH